MAVQLPAAIEHYVQIENSEALERVPECFAADAIVSDEGQTYEGVAAIRMMAATKKKYGHTLRRSSSPSMAAKLSSKPGSLATFPGVQLR